VIADLPLAGNERVLDLGCGDGMLTERIARRVPRGRVVGIDGSWGMIETARKLERENLVFRLMDIELLRFEYQFDVIFSNATLQWIRDHKRMLQRVYLRLKAGGILRFNFGGAGNCMNLVAVLRETMDEPRFSPRFAGFDWPWYFPTVEEYQDLLLRFDFSEAAVWAENADRYFADGDPIARWIDQPCLVPFLAVLPDGQKQDFRNTVVERMIKRTRQPDGRCFETFRRINVFARK
jgi:trans-aconitate 2-methyltransferase